MGWWLAGLKRSLLCCVLWVYNYENHEPAAGRQAAGIDQEDDISET